MQIVQRMLEKTATTGVLISAMGCVACFPVIGALGASLGLGILGSYEGLFINKLLPVFAFVLLIINCWGWYTHRVHYRGFLSMIGPVMILATLYPLWKYGWSSYLFYAGIVIILSVSVLDIIFPAKRQCVIN